MDLKQRTADAINREIAKYLGAVRISTACGLAYQTVMRFYNGERIKPETEKYIADTAHALLDYDVKKAEIDLKEKRQMFLHVKDWKNTFD